MPLRLEDVLHAIPSELEGHLEELDQPCFLENVGVLQVHGTLQSGEGRGKILVALLPPDVGSGHGWNLEGLVVETTEGENRRLGIASIDRARKVGARSSRVRPRKLPNNGEAVVPRDIEPRTV